MPLFKVVSLKCVGDDTGKATCESFFFFFLEEHVGGLYHAFSLCNLSSVIQAFCHPRLLLQSIFILTYLLIKLTHGSPS